MLISACKKLHKSEEVCSHKHSSAEIVRRRVRGPTEGN